MLSKNNFKEKLRKMEPKKNRYSIRKFTIGAASVLIGFFFMGFGSQTAHAATTDTPQIQASQNLQNKNVSSANDTSSGTSAHASTNDQTNTSQQAVTPTTNTTPKTSATQSEAVTTPVKNSNQTPTSQQANTVAQVQTDAELRTALNNASINKIIIENNIINEKTDANYNIASNQNGRTLTIAGKLGSAGSLINWNLQNGVLNPTSADPLELTLQNLNFENLNKNGIVSFANNGAGSNITLDNINSDSGTLIQASGVNVNINRVSVPSNAKSTGNANIEANNVVIGESVQLHNDANSNILANGNVTFTNVATNFETSNSVNGNYTPQNIIAQGKLIVNSNADVTLAAKNNNDITLSNIEASGLNVEQHGKLTVNTITTGNNSNILNNVYSTSFYPQGSNSILINNGSAIIDGNLSIYSQPTKSSSGVIAALAINAPDTSTRADVKIGSTGNLVINGGKNTRGIVFLNSDNNSNHNIGLMSGAQATFNMGYGTSNAIWNPDNLIINDGASLVINTYQDNNGNTNNGIQSDGAGVHSGVITMGFWPNTSVTDNSDITTGNEHATLYVGKDATLKIVRKMDQNSKEVGSPLITYGGNGSNSWPMTLKVDGGSFDLEDAMQYHSYSGIIDSNYEYLFNYNSNNQYVIYPLGMIDMYGVGTTDTVIFKDPKLLKLVRTGQQQGMLFRLEGYHGNNQITLEASDGNVIPLNYSTLGNVAYSNGNVSKAESYKWNIKKVSATNCTGNSSMNFYGPQWSSSFGDATPSTVVFGKNTPKADQDNFKNYFNWWSSTNLTATTVPEDSATYQPVYQPIDVDQGETAEDKVSYPVNGEINKEQPTGESYQLGKDAPAWAKIDQTTGTITLNPDSSTKAGVYNIPVTVTYENGASDTVAAKVNVIGVINGKDYQNTDDKDVWRKVTETINVVTPARAASTPYTASIDVYRTQYTNMEKPEGERVTYSDWQAASPEFTKYELPQIDDYTPILTSDEAGINTTVEKQDGRDYVPAQSVLVKDWPINSFTITVNYKADSDVTDADKYTPSYPEKVVTPGTTTTVDPIYSPSLPSDIKPTYKISSDAKDIPDWVHVDPDNGKITYNVPKDASTQVINVPVTVTYPDKSTKSTTSKVVIISGKDKVSDPAGPKSVINDPDKLPSGTTVTWTDGKQPDPNKKGDQATSVTVKVPGQDPITIPTTVTYTHGDKDTPSYPDTTVNVGKPATISPVITDKHGDTVATPKDTKFEFEPGEKVPAGITINPDTGVINVPAQSKPGSIDLKVKVIIPNQDPVTVPVKINVTNPDSGSGDSGTTVTPDNTIYNPQPQTIHTTPGAVPAASDGIANKDQLPSGTTYKWENTPNVDKPGKVSGTIIVTYPDGTTTTVPTTIIVDKKDDDNKNVKPEPGTITTPQGKLPDPASGIKNKDQLPDGTKYDWKDKPDVSNPGTSTGTIIVTYPDGTTTTVPVTVNVMPHSENDSGNNNSGMNENNHYSNSANGQVTSSSAMTTEGNNINHLVNREGNSSANHAQIRNGENEKTLPQTGEKQTAVAALVGLITAGMAAGALGVESSKKHEN